jgi:type 1 glutamine amidotransferase
MNSHLIRNRSIRLHSIKLRSITIAIVYILLFAAACVLPLFAQSAPPLRIFIRSSAKTHPPGQHDYPQFLIDWKKLLADKGAKVAGEPRFPTADELAQTDVLVIYASDAGFVSPAERAVLEPYLKRGGGVVVMHEGMCADDPAYFASIVGGAKKHGERNWSRGMIKLHFVDTAHPITKGLKDFEFDDEAFFMLTTDPAMHVLASTPLPTAPEQVVPQLWTMEKTLPGGQPYRAFVSMQGHYHVSFSNPAYQTLLLRGIAWAGKRPPELLLRGTGTHE